MIRAIIFDLDGVLIDLKRSHFECLNNALLKYDKSYVISLDDHYKKFDGLPTKDKLKILAVERALPVNLFNEINDLKQQYTIDYIQENYSNNVQLIGLFEYLKSKNIKIAISSNSVRNTIYTAAVKLGIIKFVDIIVSNQDVKNSKPNPEIYLKTISLLGLSPSECLILEDSPYGIEAAEKSGSHVLKVKNTFDVNIQNILNEIEFLNKSENQSKWKGKKFNILIPMAGAGSRFSQAGYTFPKPLIEVNNKPMIQVVVENLNIDATYIYVVQKSHYEKYQLEYLLNLLTPNCEIVQIDTLTEGAACTTLLAEKYIDNDKHLLIANSDQFIDWDSNRFYYSVEDEEVDGGILCFKGTAHPKWSFVKLNDNGEIIEIAEKKPISDIATVGIYYWNKGSDYVKYAKQMIEKNIRTNNEFYVAPVYNEAILDKKIIKPYYIEETDMWGLGTPEDLKRYLDHH